MGLFHDTLLRLVRGGHDFTDRQKCVLFSVKDEMKTVRAIAAELNISKPAVTRSVDRLEAAGLVVRKDDPADRRSVLIKTAPPGRKMVQLMEST